MLTLYKQHRLMNQTISHLVIAESLTISRLHYMQVLKSSV